MQGIIMQTTKYYPWIQTNFIFSKYGNTSEAIPTTTSIAIARLQAGHIDLYKPGTRRERGYMSGIASVYKDDCIDDASTIASSALQKEPKEVISGIEFTKYIPRTRILSGIMKTNWHCKKSGIASFNHSISSI
jgi:hypothetical protein